jgi:transposase
MSSVTPAAGPIHLGMDTSKKTIVVGILMPGDEVPVIDRIWNEEGSVRHLVSRLGDPAGLRAFAPSLIPRRAGERVKTDKRDASRLVGIKEVAAMLGVSRTESARAHRRTRS